MVFPRELVEQRRDGIPRRVRVVAQSSGVRTLNAQTCEQERRCRVRGGPSSEADLARGGVRPSSEADLARGGVQPCRSGGPRGPPGS
jgi:hypothetical protein